MATTPQPGSPTDPARRKHVYDVDFQSLDHPFIRDIAATFCAKAERRMGHKNQVATMTKIPHMRNRATHVGEVTAHAIKLADHLGLDAWLAQAIARGHDLGHVPFGHQGEHYLKNKMGKGFNHEVMGVVICQHVERGETGLNLTHATLDGMWRHSGKSLSPNMSQEALIVRYADKFAYLFSDYNDFKRLNWHCAKELDERVSWFGYNQRDRTFRAMVCLCEESHAAGHVVFEASEAAVKFNHLRTLMYHEYVKVVEQDVARFLDPIWRFLEGAGLNPALGIALLTDDEVIEMSTQGMLNWSHFRDTGLREILDKMGPEAFNRVDMLSLDLDW